MQMLEGKHSPTTNPSVMDMPYRDTSPFVMDMPVVRGYESLQEAMSVPDKLKEMYGRGDMSSCSVVAYVEGVMGFISPSAASDFSVASEADWQVIRDRVIDLLESGQNAAYILCNEVRTRKGQPLIPDPKPSYTNDYAKPNVADVSPLASLSALTTQEEKRSTGSDASVQDTIAVPNNNKHTKKKAPDRVNDILFNVLRDVGALDADGEGMTVTGLNEEQRASKVAKLQKAIDLIKAMPVVEREETAASRETF